MVASTPIARVVNVGSHVDGRNVAQMRMTLNAVLDSMSGESGVIVLDMASLELIDAAGLGMLTAAHLRAEHAGQRLVLRNCSKEIRRVLAVTRLNRILHVDRRRDSLSA